MNNEFLMGHSLLLAHSFLKTTGLILCDLSTGTEVVQYLYNAPFALVSHGVEEDPIFNYGNVKAQELWEMSWNEFVKMPSRSSAGILEQKDRDALLREAKEKGYVGQYFGMRISKSGKIFEIQDTVLWTLYDENNVYKGQAAFIPRWRFL